MTCYFYLPEQERAVRGASALCSRGSFRAYAASVSGPLVFYADYFLFDIPQPEGDGIRVTLTDGEKKRLLPRYSEELMVNYSLLDGQMLLWEDGRSVRDKLRAAGLAGVKEAYIPMEFREALRGSQPPPPSSPSRYRSV